MKQEPGTFPFTLDTSAFIAEVEKCSSALDRLGEKIRQRTEELEELVELNRALARMDDDGGLQPMQLNVTIHGEGDSTEICRNLANAMRRAIAKSEEHGGGRG